MYYSVMRTAAGYMLGQAENLEGLKELARENRAKPIVTLENEAKAQQVLAKLNAEQGAK